MIQKSFELTNKEIEEILTAGSLAPSGGNVQPWRIIVKNNKTMELMLDKKRADTFLDVGHLASYMALGSFMENLTIASESMGLEYVVREFTPTRLSKPFVQIIFTGRKENNPPHPLYEQIGKRATNRKLYDGKLISENVVDNLKALTRNKNKNFTLLAVHSEKDKKTVADILGKADGIRTFHKVLFKQMLSEIRWNEREVNESRDGIDMVTLELPAMVGKMMKLMHEHPIIVSTFPREVFENQAKPLLMHSSHLCCLAMNEKPTPTSLFTTGRVLQSLWLTATKHNLAFHPWTVLPFFLMRIDFFEGKGFSKQEIVELRKLDEKVKKVFALSKQQIPVFIFRLSYAKPPTSRSLRLTWKDFTDIR